MNPPHEEMILVRWHCKSSIPTKHVLLIKKAGRVSVKWPTCLTNWRRSSSLSRMITVCATLLPRMEHLTWVESPVQFMEAIWSRIRSFTTAKIRWVTRKCSSTCAIRQLWRTASFRSSIGCRKIQCKPSKITMLRRYRWRREQCRVASMFLSRKLSIKSRER